MRRGEKRPKKKERSKKDVTKKRQLRKLYKWKKTKIRDMKRPNMTKEKLISQNT